MIHLVVEGLAEQLGRAALTLVLLGVAIGGGAVLLGVWVTSLVLA